MESWVLFVDLVKAFDSVPRDVLWKVLAKFGVPPHLLKVIMRMHENLTVTFELAGVTVEVPNKSGVKQGEPQAPKLFNFVMQACLGSLGESWQAGSLKFHTNTKISGARGGKVSGNNWRKTGEFSFEIWCSLNADDAGLPQNKRNELLIAANDVDDHLQLFGLHSSCMLVVVACAPRLRLCFFVRAEATRMETPQT